MRATMAGLLTYCYYFLQPAAGILLARVRVTVAHFPVSKELQK